MIKTRSLGFTLIELMIAVVIISILASFAIPSYSNHVTSTKRAEAMAALTQAAQAMERHKSSNNFSYDNATIGAAAATDIFTDQVPVDGGSKYYDITLVNDATTYTLTATATGAQNGDGDLTLTQTGARTWDGNNCWPTSKSNCP